MDTENPSAPSCAESRVAARKHPNRGSGGLTHDNARHTSHFVVIGNHLAQHPTLSALAIGLGVHIQSLPKGAQVDIKSLALRFPEGRDRIGAALRELEAEGYLRRERERIPDGRIVTRTVSCNQPGHRTAGTETPGRPARHTATTKNLPTEPLTRPAALLAHRLTAQLPPPPPFRPPAAPAPQPRHPFQTCDGCDRPFRAPTPGHCRDCRTDLPEGT
ncbi:helix-turn-helix domain-containing protein [Streptomyces humi]